MDSYLITVIYAVHDRNDETPFPSQTIPDAQLQVIRVREEDNFHPHRSSLSALKAAQGKFAILLDDGDEFAENFLERLCSSFPSDAAFAAPAQSFRHAAAADRLLAPPAGTDILTSIAESPFSFPTELPGLLFRTEELLRLLPSCLSSAEPEKALLLSLLKEHPSFLYLGSLTLHYDWPRESDFLYDSRAFSRDWYFTPFCEFAQPLLQNAGKDGDSPALHLQSLALYMVLCRIESNLNNRNKHVISREEALSYTDVFSRVLQFVDDETILRCPFLTDGHALPVKLLLLRMKRRDFTWYPQFSCQTDTMSLVCGAIPFAKLSDLNVRISLIDFIDGRLEIDASIQGLCSPDQIRIFADFDGDRYPVVYNQRYSMAKCFGVTYTRMITFHVSVPVPRSAKERILRFYLCAGESEYSAPITFPDHPSRFSKEFTHAYWLFGPYFSQWRSDGIHIRPAKKLHTLRSELGLWKQMWRRKGGLYKDQLPLKMINFVLRPYFSRKKIWLFFDKIYKGGDSAEYIYKYAQAHSDGIKKYYLLDKSCADYHRMRKEGFHPLVRGSLRHRLVFLNADIVIASNSTIFAFNDYTFERSLPIRGDVHFDVACVQHGMSIQKIALAQQRLRDNTKLYFCASKYEIENLSKPVYDYNGYDILKLTGVPRYDGLHDRRQKIILLSPTWRMNSALPVSRNEGVARDYNPNFRHTDYFKIYNSLINDPRLLAAARQYGYRIQYVLHPIVSPQYEDFTKNELVDIIPSTGEMSYEKIFCEAALMVTDFSGVQFDFAYMRKPVIYLHHNDIPQHYENGTFFYDTMGFGEICHTNAELIDVLCGYMKHDCTMPQLYRDRADDFFAFSDDRSCERIYPILLDHEKKVLRRRSTKAD